MKMKLYYSPGACSLASHIALVESKADFVLEKVNLKTHVTASEKNYYDINPKGSVPCIELLDSGERLTENIAVLPFIADHGQGHLMPQGGMKRAHAQEWLGYIASEVHHAFMPYFTPGTTSETKDEASRILSKKLQVIDEQLRRSTYIAGADCTVADFYLFVIEQWLEHIKHPAANLSSVQRHLRLMRERPSVKEALKQES